MRALPLVLALALAGPGCRSAFDPIELPPAAGESPPLAAGERLRLFVEMLAFRTGADQRLLGAGLVVANPGETARFDIYAGEPRPPRPFGSFDEDTGAFEVSVTPALAEGAVALAFDRDRVVVPPGVWFGRVFDGTPLGPDPILVLLRVVQATQR